MAAYNADVPFSLLLADALDRAGLDDKSAAPLFSVGQNTVNRWRNGRSVPEDDKLPLLVEHLGSDEETWARALRVGRRYLRVAPAELIAANLELERQVAELRRSTGQGTSGDGQ